MARSVRGGTKRAGPGEQARSKRASKRAANAVGSIGPEAYDRWTSTNSSLEFRILGPLEVRRGAQSLPLGSPKQRAVLAFLLLHANDLVPRERLIEEVWAGAAPPTVNAALNGYLTKLRRLLAHGAGEVVLTTQSPGYVLHLDAEQLDASRFERLVEEGRTALAAGDPERAARTLREGLALWRGSALADLAYEAFAQREIARLEELRLTAREERIEADLALGRTGRLIPELEALVAEHPHRERLRAQLMLALYRSGRQADALDAYRHGRRALDELGIEPGRRLQELERAILQQDSSLEAPPEAAPPADEAPAAAGPGRRRVGLRRAAVLAVVVGIGAAVAVAAIVRSDLDPSPPPAPVVLKGNSVVVIDPRANSIIGEIEVGGQPSAVKFGAGSGWVLNRDANTLLRFDPRKLLVTETIGLGEQTVDLGFGAGAVWIGLAKNLVLRVDPLTNRVVERVSLPGGADAPCGVKQLVTGPKQVWVNHCGGTLSRVDPVTNTSARLRRDVAYVAYGEGSLWLVADTEAGELERVDPRTNRVLDTIEVSRLEGVRDQRVVAGAGAVWTRRVFGGTIWRIDPQTGFVEGSIDVGRPVVSVAPAADTLWVGGNDRTLVRIARDGRRIGETIRLHVWIALNRSGGGVTVGEGAVWVATLPRGRLGCSGPPC